MSFHSIVPPISPNKQLNFIEHPSFEKKCSKAIAKFRISKDFEHLKKILNVQFSPTDPRPVIGPGKIHRLKDFIDYSIWKVEMSAQGLRKNQSPRVWFGIKGDTIVFLCIKFHGENYDDGIVTTEAESLISDIF